MSRLELCSIIALSIVIGCLPGLAVGYHLGKADMSHEVYEYLAKRNMGHFEMDKKNGKTVFVFHRIMEKE